MAKSFTLSFSKKKLNSPMASDQSNRESQRGLQFAKSVRDESSTLGQSKVDQEEGRTLTIHDVDLRTLGDSDTKKTPSDITFHQKKDDKIKFN